MEYGDRQGREHVARAGGGGLAANGVGTPRLLLLSARPGHPHGLANRSDQVGRRLMVHPFATVDGVFDAPLHSWVGHAGPKIVSYEFYETDRRRGFVRGAKWSLGGIAGPVGIALTRRPDGTPGWGAGHHAGMRERPRPTMSWSIFTEDLPEAHNRVTLDERLVDRHGVPQLCFDVRFRENEAKLNADSAAQAEAMLKAAGMQNVVALARPSVPGDAIHEMGGACMGRDPKTSVLDAWNRAHEVPNLYVTDGASMSSCGVVNPSLTFMALTARAADHAATRWRDGQV